MSTVSSRRRKRASLACVAAAICFLGLNFPFVSSAHGEVALNCPYADDRTPSDKLPRPGVVVRQATEYSTSYSLQTINNLGKLEHIFIDSIPSSSTELVAVWQNGTSCYGSEISRNAWAAAPDGRVFGTDGYSGPPAANFGDMGGQPLNKPIVGMSPTSTGLGYWLVASDGGIFAFGDAQFYGSMGGRSLNKPITGMSVTPTGGGYWLVASDGGMFSFGDAQFYGSMGGRPLNRPVSGMTTTPTGHGYWLTAADGGIFCFGDADFRGSTGGRTLSSPIAGMVPNESGYTLIGRDGQLYPFQ